MLSWLADTAAFLKTNKKVKAKIYFRALLPGFNCVNDSIKILTVFTAFQGVTDFLSSESNNGHNRYSPVLTGGEKRQVPLLRSYPYYASGSTTSFV